MKLNNKGFALTSMIYMLLVLFLMTMLLVLANLATRKVVLDKIKNDVKENLNQGGLVAQNIYIVTFDPTIGQIDQKTKQVKYNEPYGELPTPTREEYTFMGWRGKNLFNKDDIPTNTSLYIKGDGTTATNSEYSIYQVNVNPNTTYTITNSGESTAPGYAIYDSSGTRLDGANYANNATITFTTPATASYMKFSVVTKTTSNRYDKETFQLEEGSAATTYEPYQEYTSDTIVAKQENHTLKAIWQPNS